MTGPSEDAAREQAAREKEKQGAGASTHRCTPERGIIEGTVFYSGKSKSWVAITVPPGQPSRQQRLEVRFCPWCGRDLSQVTPADGVDLVE